MDTSSALAAASGDAPGSRLARIGVVTICFLIVLLDGLDTTSIAFVAPALAREWGLPPAAFTPAFVATSVGAVVGYLACGPLAGRWGQRMVGGLSVVLFGLGTLLSAWSPDVPVLAALRFVAAVGLGGALPVAVSVAAGATPARYKETAAMLVAAGLSAGAVIGGMAGVPLMRQYGWHSVFMIGGILPLVLLPFFLKCIPGRDVATHSSRPAQGGSVAALFDRRWRLRTWLLWLFAFLIFVDAYALTFWIPTLLAEFGFGPAQAPAATAAFGMGGLLGSLAMMALVAKLGVKRLLAITTLIAIASILIVNQAALAPGQVLAVIGGMGAGLITGCVGQSALAVSYYPPEIRTTGVGWAAASGRIGSIVGPALGGLMLALNWNPRDIVLTAVVPAAAALAVLAALAWVDRRPDAGHAPARTTSTT